MALVHVWKRYFQIYPLNNFFNGYICLHCATNGKVAECFERFKVACGDVLIMRAMCNWFVRRKKCHDSASGKGDFTERPNKRLVVDNDLGDSNVRLLAGGYMEQAVYARPGLLEDGARIPSDATKHRYANIMMDYWFKRTFGMPERSRLMLLLLKELIPERDIKEITYLPTEHGNPLPEMKDVRIDVECTDEKGARFIVEMQVCKQDFFRERMLFYSSYALLGQMMRGKGPRMKIGRRKAARIMGDLSIMELRDRAISSGKVNPSFYNYPPVYMVSLLNFSIHPGSEDVLYR
jgi:hypothetical protein